jgi:hypothetical protein
LEGPSEEQLQFVKNRSLKSLRLKFQTCFDWVDTHSSRNTFFPDSDWTIEDNFKEIENKYYLANFSNLGCNNNLF